MKRALARLVDAALNLYAPVVHGRTYEVFTTDMVGASRLADAEADIDAWEPDILNEYVTDDVWAAEYRRLNVVPDLPAGAGAAMTPPSAAASATGAGGFPTITDPVATVVAVVLRGQGIQSSAIYADLIARELRHHFDFQPK